MYCLARNIKHTNHGGKDERQAIVEMAWNVIGDGESRAAYVDSTQLEPQLR